MTQFNVDAGSDLRSDSGRALVGELNSLSVSSLETARVCERCQTGVAAAAAIVATLALLVLLGWLLNIHALKSVLPTLVTMKVNTAICFELMAGALWFSRTEATRKRYSLAVWMLIAFVSLIAAVVLCEYAFDWNAGIDELIFSDVEHLHTALPPGRFAPGSGICFLLLSGAILLIDARPKVSHVFTLVTTLVTLISLIGYLYGLRSLSGAHRYTSLAINTVIGFITLCSGIFASRPTVGLPALLIQSRAQGSSVHTLLIAAVIVPTALGSLTLKGQRLGWYGAEFTFALFTVMLIVLTVIVTWVASAERQRGEVKRLRAEAALRASEVRFRTMADNIPNLAWMARADGHIFWYNRRWYEYTGKRPEEMEGWGWQTVHDPEMLPVVLEGWKKAIATGVPFEMVFPLLGADGRFRAFLTRVQPLLESSGRVEQWFGTNTDISSERDAQEELLNANRRLEEFAFVSSHDLQEPLRMVNIYTQLLLRVLADKLDERTTQYASHVQQGVRRMEQLIGDLLKFSRTVSDRSDTDAERYGADLNLCFETALATLASRVEETQATVTATPLPRVRGEEHQMTQLFQNLLSNSLKYRSKNEPPQVRISVREENRQSIISFQDNGIGFEPQYAEQIFGLFKRLHKEEYPGTGLGLAICQRIVERYGGKMWAEGNFGKGACFHIALPTIDTETDHDGVSSGVLPSHSP